MHTVFVEVIDVTRRISLEDRRTSESKTFGQKAVLEYRFSYRVVMSKGIAKVECGEHDTYSRVARYDD